MNLLPNLGKWTECILVGFIRLIQCNYLGNVTADRRQMSNIILCFSKYLLRKCLRVNDSVKQGKMPVNLTENKILNILLLQKNGDNNAMVKQWLPDIANKLLNVSNTRTTYPTGTHETFCGECPIAFHGPQNSVGDLDPVVEYSPSTPTS